jgi:hypothetical protein
LFKTISGRKEYTDPGEKFENVTMMLYQPVTNDGTPSWVRLVDCLSGDVLSEEDYFSMIRNMYNLRNPHALIGEIE